MNDHYYNREDLKKFTAVGEFQQVMADNLGQLNLSLEKVTFYGQRQNTPADTRAPAK